MRNTDQMLVLDYKEWIAFGHVIFALIPHHAKERSFCLAFLGVKDCSQL